MVSKVLFRLARNRLFDVVVQFGFAHLSALLPVRRVVETRQVIAFHHPRPSWPRHVLFVPKAAIPSLLDVPREQVAVVRELFRLALDVAARQRLDRDGFVVMVNGGAYQDVGQLHLHLASPLPAMWYACPDEVPADVLLETDALVAFRHPRPRRATHVAIVSRGRDGAKSAAGAGRSAGDGFDDAFIEAAIVATQQLARSLRLLDGGYTLVVSSPGGSSRVRPCFHLVAGATLPVEREG
jgi:histidine triad (HIT) family protein